MPTFEAIALGIVQGLSEFLPISSSGHLVLFQTLFGWQEPNLLFDVWLHFATLLAVLIFFRKRLLSLSVSEIGVIMMASLPIALVGLLWRDNIEALFGSTLAVSLALILTAIFNFTSNHLLKKQDETKLLDKPLWKSGFIIGVFQSLALLPGLSRSGSTLLGSIWQKLDRQAAFEFSFIISVPAILGANLLQLIEYGPRVLTTVSSSPYLLGFGAAFMAGYISLYLVKRVVNHARLDIFGWYCLVVGLTVLKFSL